MNQKLIEEISLKHKIFIQRKREVLPVEIMDGKIGLHGSLRAFEMGAEIPDVYLSKIENYLDGYMNYKTISAYEVYRAWRHEKSVKVSKIAKRMKMNEMTIYSKLQAGNLSKDEKEKLRKMSGGVIKVGMWD